MDEKRIDLKTALRELAAEESGKAGPHVGSKRLVAYRQGTLPAAEREAVQEHLSLCTRCTGLLLELRLFEATAAEGDAELEPLRQEAWESLVRHLPPPPPRARRTPRYLYAAVAALLLATVGLSFWAAVTVQRSRRLEQRLEAREATLADLRSTLAETERQLAAVRGQIESRGQTAGRVEELEARLAELTSAPEELRRAPQAAGGDRFAAAAGEIEVSVAPRFVLRGQEPSDGLLQGKGAVSSVRLPEKGDRFTLALSLAGHAVYGEYRLELVDQSGRVLWSGRRPGNALLGDAGTSVLVNGLGPGAYRLRIEGLRPDRTELLAEYLLQVEPR
ncbi:MAG TPA: zf-HC2 domain-containing protein [Thermoanaerobaculia bacterium]|nr:zf-HC2 domain-containing protein [Thermoanaerobaculia bacterium]